MNNQYQKDFRKIISRHSKAHDTSVITGSEEGLGRFRLHYQFFFPYIISISANSVVYFEAF